ncbi:MAG: GNAT family N-acetyltransferase [Clostridiales bacterium]|nr:GNAT family N-acetyltransferase [Clostridiales bacterium]
MKPIDLSIRELVTAFIIKHWYSDTMMIRGEKIDMTAVDGFAAFDEAGHEIKGLITYIIRNDICEITSLDSVQEKKGIGTALIETVSESAKKAGCRLLRLLTTNDNLNAIGFYQKRGFELMGINRGAIDYERLTKPEIPLVGQNNIPIHHEIEFAMML